MTPVHSWQCVELSLQIRALGAWDVSAGFWFLYPSLLWQEPSQSRSSCVLRWSIFSLFVWPGLKFAFVARVSNLTAEVLWKLMPFVSDRHDYPFKKHAHKRQINWPIRKFLHCCCFWLLVELSVCFFGGECKTLRDSRVFVGSILFYGWLCLEHADSEGVWAGRHFPTGPDHRQETQRTRFVMWPYMHQPESKKK